MTFNRTRGLEPIRSEPIRSETIRSEPIRRQPPTSETPAHGTDDPECPRCGPGSEVVCVGGKHVTGCDWPLRLMYCLECRQYV